MLTFYLSLIEGDSAKARFAQFYERALPRLYQVALRILHTPEMAEDAVQASMLKIVDRHMEKFLKISQKSWDETEFWAVTIVRNTALDMRRKEAWTTPLPEEWNPPAPSDTEGEAGRAYLRELIRALPEAYRAVLEPKLLLEWENVEIARSLGLTEAAVAKRAARGRRLLMDQLERGEYV